MIRKYSIASILALVGSAVLSLSLITCASAAVFGGQFNRKGESIPFDVAGWNAPRVDANGMFTGIRLKMVDDLLERYDFHGWALQDVQDLLGQPDDKTFKEQKQIMEYDLRDGLNFLVFETDNQQRVVDYHVRRDD